MTTHRKFTIAALVFALLCTALFAFTPILGSLKNGLPEEIALKFKLVSEGETFVFNEFVHDNPVGEGQYRFHDIRFYISNVVLSDGQTTLAIEESYHLIRFDKSSSEFSVMLKNPGFDQIDQVSFLIGLDPKANNSLMSLGDLDPNNRMAWNWEIGYKFLLAEGAFKFEEAIRPLVYHIGFNDSSRLVTFELPRPMNNAADASIQFLVDVNRLFDGQNKIDMRSLNTIKMDRQDAAKMAENFVNFIQLH